MEGAAYSYLALHPVSLSVCECFKVSYERYFCTVNGNKIHLKKASRPTVDNVYIVGLH